MPRLITDDELLDAIACVFQDHGYAGASMSLIAKATGLGRASLYHRFPGGKAEMAAAVMDRSEAWLEGVALVPLSSDQVPRDRVAEMARRISAHYRSGTRSCLLDVMSLGESHEPLRKRVERALETWIGAIAGLLREQGDDPTRARRLAEDAVIRLQGGLVLARGLRDPGPFLRTLESLPESLLGHLDSGAGMDGAVETLDHTN